MLIVGELSRENGENFTKAFLSKSPARESLLASVNRAGLEPATPLLKVRLTTFSALDTGVLRSCAVLVVP